jgi:hypothetical protein
MTKCVNRISNRPNGEIHEQVHIKYGDFDADVDVGIAPLILEIWKAGIPTMMSCEENRPGWTWIAFVTAEYAAQFLNAVARYDENVDSLYNRILHSWDPPTGTVEGFWEYVTMPFNMAVIFEETEEGALAETCTGSANCLFDVSIRFPRSDLPMLVNNLADYNRTAAKRLIC